MTPFTKLTAVAAPLDMANIDTDQIIPARFLRKLRGPGYERLAFHDIRFDADDREKPGFALNQAPYRQAKILVAGANFGCGSSREAAVYVLYDYGIRSVIAEANDLIDTTDKLHCLVTGWLKNNRPESL